jgi:hypothetical protein
MKRNRENYKALCLGFKKVNCHMSAILALGRLRQDHGEFEASLGCRRHVASKKKKTWFFEKPSKTDKPLAKLIKRREKILINKIREEKGDSTTNTNEIQGIIREYFYTLIN